MQKKKIVEFISGILIIFILLIAISISKLEFASQEYSKQLKKLPYTFDLITWINPNPSTVGFDGSFPEMPSEMMVYKVIHPNNINETYVRGLAKKHFGMPPGAKIERSPNLGLYWLKTSTHRFQFDPKTGSFNILKFKEKGTKHSKNREDYPSDEECRKIAEKYIKSRGLFDEDMYFGSIVDNTSSGVMSVGFGRKIDGYKKWGAGGAMSIQLGQDGEVVKFRKSWRELASYKPYPIKTAKQALRDLHNRKGFLTGRKGKIKSITIRYYISSEKQDYVQPIYHFECTGPEGNFYGIVPAIKDKFIQSKKEYWKEIKEKAARRSK
jgi:hypothetical protein